jgi:hypothetical protein
MRFLHVAAGPGTLPNRQPLLSQKSPLALSLTGQRGSQNARGVGARPVIRGVLLTDAQKLASTQLGDGYAAPRITTGTAAAIAPSPDTSANWSIPLIRRQR